MKKLGPLVNIWGRSLNSVKVQKGSHGEVSTLIRAKKNLGHVFGESWEFSSVLQWNSCYGAGWLLVEKMCNGRVEAVHSFELRDNIATLSHLYKNKSLHILQAAKMNRSKLELDFQSQAPPSLGLGLQSFPPWWCQAFFDPKPSHKECLECRRDPFDLGLGALERIPALIYPLLSLSIISSLG